jgi:hypothetical protein
MGGKERCKMKLLNIIRMRLIVIGTIVAMAVGGGSTKADFIFGEPTNLGPTINSPQTDASGSFSSDGLEMYFDSNRSGPMIDDIYVSRRATTDDAWGTPVKLDTPVNSPDLDVAPVISTDGLSLYFTSLRYAGGYGGLDIWVTTRETIDDDWSEPSNLGPKVNCPQEDVVTSISFDGLVLYFYSRRPGGYGDYDIWVSTHQTIDADWGEPVNLGPTVNSSASDGCPCISADGLLMFFHSNRPGGFGDYDLYMTTRSTIDDDWGTPVNLGPAINTSALDGFATILPDGSALLFASNRPGGVGDWDIWQAPILPVVDLNSDGIVDVKDIVIITEHWGEDFPLCDIGPMPWGDGIVDVHDLEVLIEYIEPIGRSLIAHWALDETEGMFAKDSAGDNDAVVLGGIEWQPTNGQINGALQLNGIDGYAVTGPILNPAGGPFSIIAWINGGAPGQVVVSQQTMTDWLAVDAEGHLMTELKSSDQLAGPLLSETVITDGQWHRIGLVWDGSNRTLYVDGVAVAEDTQHGLEGSQIGLYIGTGKTMESDSYFSGLVDDIRIYNRAVRP